MQLSFDIWSCAKRLSININGCRTNGLSDQWAVGPMGCRTNGLSEYWDVIVAYSVGAFLQCIITAFLPNFAYEALWATLDVLCRSVTELCASEKDD